MATNFPTSSPRSSPARELPYLADVARLEAARTRAYHADDAAPLDAAAFAALDPGAADALRLTLHPSPKSSARRIPSSRSGR